MLENIWAHTNIALTGVADGGRSLDFSFDSPVALVSSFNHTEGCL